MDTLPDRFPHLPDRLAGLGTLAFNLWWSWHPQARMLFKILSREGWKDSFQNPVKLLEILPKSVLEATVANPNFLKLYDEVLAEFQHLENRVCWFTENIQSSPCFPIAYFSLEYGLHRSLPFFAGGLGFLAGDHLKESSDLGIPVLGVGFMYPEGYLRQLINANGWQEGADEILDRDAAPIRRVLNDQGKQLIVEVPFITPSIFVSVWRTMVGRVPLYLMDTHLEQNDPQIRRISDHLYISDLEQRLLQEIVLGIGGSEMLKTMGIKHSVLHLNEGHAAFALLERVRERLEESGMNWEDAVREVRGTSVFTTHTPVPAGHDVFPGEMLEKYFNKYYTRLGLTREPFMQLGASPENSAAGFNMTAFALRLSGFHNGVSKKHGEVSRRMWQSLWPDVSENRVPIDSITNGVHVPTWMDPKFILLLNKYLGPNWLATHDDPALWERIDHIPDEELWQTHIWLKMKLINRIRERARQRWALNGADCNNVLVGGALLDPTILTIGFARRFVTYKRADLIFQDPARLQKLLGDPWRPIQIFFAGKAHPADDPAKRILQRIFNLARSPNMAGRLAFVEDYGEQTAQYLVHGVDVWLNNPLPPLEACGTSGMKASLNGVPNLSVLDGWWSEAFDGSNGWAFDSKTGDQQNIQDAAMIYEILERQVIPLFYEETEDNIPHGWVKVMKNAMKSTAARFSARRMVKEYCSKFYQTALKVAK